ncbi:CBM_HP2_G0009880.mRNA.1.CDS.1 [Saccharomyces cerevisiae]|nr:CBM_HP2_G0009880.mRNA.1.CDS.1 [Saccharomyces cerevisiae]CAI6420561.1 CBM_HP2_G0009880.mRNA.1.CDS.1 [Saccharomyces cerevisiae]
MDKVTNVRNMSVYSATSISVSSLTGSLVQRAGIISAAKAPMLFHQGTRKDDKKEVSLSSLPLFLWT